MGYDLTKATGRSRSSRTIGVLSDIHDGSTHAVCSHEPIRQSTGEEYKKSDVNRLFLEHWDACVDWLKNAHIQVVNGEPFNGANRREMGFENWTSDIGDQVEDSYKLLYPLNPKYYMWTRGSNYHVRDGHTSYEEILAQRLKSLPYSAYFLRKKFQLKEGRKPAMDGSARRVDDFLFFKLHGNIGFSRRYYYRATALSAEMASLEFDRGYFFGNDENINVLGRGHVHYYVEVRYPSSIGFTTPCWKLADSYLMHHGMSGTRPAVGAVKVIVEQNGEISIDKLLMKKKYPKPYTPDLTNL
jgi:hypothetical protein